MNLIDLKKDIVNNDLNRFYHFLGEEIGVMNIYINQMSKSIGADIKRADKVQDIWSKITVKNTLIKTKPAIYVIRDDKEFLSNKIWQDKALYSRIQNNILILISSKPSAKFTEQYEETEVEFIKMTDTQLAKAIKKETRWNDSNCLYLAQVCNNDYTQAMNEIDKLKRVKGDIKTLIDELVNVKPIYDLNSFHKLVGKRRGRGAIKCMDFLLEEKTSGILMLSTMYQKFRDGALVVGYKNDNKGQEKTGLTYYAFNEAKENIVANYSPVEILKALRLIEDSLNGIKKGKYEEKFAVKRAIINILVG